MIQRRMRFQVRKRNQCPSDATILIMWSIGSILLMPKEVNHNIPLGLHSTPARTSHSSLPSPFPRGREPGSTETAVVGRHQTPSQHSAKTLVNEEKKRTKDGQIILEPQPEDSQNDPLNWASWRR